MKIKKILWLMPLTLIMFGCKKATSKDTNTTKDNTTSDTITQTQIFDVVFDLNGAEGSIDIQHIEKGGKVLKPNDPVRTGYTFKGWKFDGKDWDFNESVVTGVTIITADWEAIDYQMTYTSLNEGGIIFEYGKTFHYNDTVTVIALPKKGYSLEGWYLDDDLDHPVSTDDDYSFNMPDKDYEISAKWIQYTLTTSKNIDGGTITSYSAAPITAGTSVTLEAQTTTGYTWLGWYKGDNLISSDTTFTYEMERENVNIVAKWGLYTLTTTINIDEAGSILPLYNNDGIEVGSSITLSASANTGYVFKGWYINDEQVGTNPTYTFTMGSNNLVVEARFDYDYVPLNLTRNIEDAGTVEGAGSYQYKEERPIAAITTDEKYKFIGWYLNDVLVDTNANITVTMPYDEVTYEARWELKYPELEAAFKYTLDGDDIIVTGVKDKTVTELVIPDYVTQIKQGALSGLSKLETLTLPFPGSVAYEYLSSNQCGMGSIFGTSSYTGAMEVEQTEIMGNISIKHTYYVPESLTTIIITNCENIQYGAFKDFTNIEHIYLPDNVKTVELGFIRGCENLELNYYGNGRYLGSVDHPYLVLLQPNTKYISSLEINAECVCFCDEDDDFEYYWSNCNYLESVYYDGTMESWFNIKMRWYATPLYKAENIYFLDPDGDVTFASKKYSLVTEVIVPNTVERIDQYQLQSFKNAVTIVVPDNITLIDGNAMRYCSSLVNIVLPNSIEEMYGNIFEDCTNLTNVYFNGTIEDWFNIKFMRTGTSSTPMYYASHFFVLDTNGDVEFKGNKYSEVIDLVLPESITELHTLNTYGFSSVKTIILPTTLTTIESSAFSGWSSLEKIYYLGDIASWSSISGSNTLPEGKIYYYSSEEPSEAGNYWRYIDGVPTIWETE